MPPPYEVVEKLEFGLRLTLRLVATIPNRTGRDCSRQLEVCEVALAELVTFAKLDEAIAGKRR